MITRRFLMPAPGPVPALSTAGYAASTCTPRHGAARRGGSRSLGRRGNGAGRRRGIALIYTALGLATFIGITALVVDMGRLYTRRAQAQKAADSAALAGAYELNNGEPAAQTAAIQYARLNGYNVDRGDTVQSHASATQGTALNRMTVAVGRSEPLYFLPAFAALLGMPSTTSNVGAAATAEASFPNNRINSPISYGAAYGSTGGYANVSVFGQDGRYEYGDAYSPTFLNDGTTPNTGTADDPHGANFKGYDYTVNIDGGYATKNGTSQVQLEIFDPDCYVSDTSNMLGSWDEYHTTLNGSVSPTTTTYTLLAPKRSPSDPDVVIATASYGADASTNMKWTTPGGFKFDINSYGGPGAYTLRVKGGAGTSENGFSLRAGKPHTGLDTQADEATWKAQYNFGSDSSANGTDITSHGKAVVNFVKTGQVEINMGFVPADATKVLVDKFDTDVGFQSITYSIKTLGGAPVTASLPPGVKAENGQWAPTDELAVPSNYPAEGANWYVTYSAGAYDTSNWIMSYFSSSTTPSSPPGSVRLVD